jgi:hypothetical protein
MRNVQEPTVRKDESPMGGDIYEHPAYASIGASRVSGGHTHLYDSDFKHSHYMTVRIYKSQLCRSLSNDWHFSPNTPYIEVSMSEAQWATFVSSPNIGSGVPCTLESLNGEHIPRLPAPKPRVEQFGTEQDDRMSRAMASISEAMAAVDECKLSEKAKKELKSKMMMACQNIGANQKFVADQFGEHMEKVVEHAKIEVNAYATATIQRAGLQAIAGKGPILELGSD